MILIRFFPFPAWQLYTAIKSYLKQQAKVKFYNTIKIQLCNTMYDEINYQLLDFYWQFMTDAHCSRKIFETDKKSTSLHTHTLMMDIMPLTH